MSRPYTIKALAEYWGYSPESVRKLLVSGELTGFRLGGKMWRIRPEEVERYECQQTTGLVSDATIGVSSGMRTATDIASGLQRQRRLKHVLPFIPLSRSTGV